MTPEQGALWAVGFKRELRILSERVATNAASIAKFENLAASHEQLQRDHNLLQDQVLGQEQDIANQYCTTNNAIDKVKAKGTAQDKVLKEMSITVGDWIDDIKRLGMRLEQIASNGNVEDIQRSVGEDGFFR